MSGIFVSYRRASSSAVVYRLVDELKERFGDEAIFFDVESIDPGMSFAQAIQQALGKSTIALIVIGPQWVHVTDEGGKRRLENPDDWVRHEVYAALNSRARVIPLLVEGAEIPVQNLLPENIRELANLQAFTIAKSPEYWDFDIKRLEERLRKIDRNLPKTGSHPGPHPPVPPPVATGHFSRKVAWGLGLTAFFAFGFADPEPDSAGYYGIALFFGVALALHLMGLSDIHKGLTRGKGAAILGIVSSVALAVLALIAGAVIDGQAILQDALVTDDNQSYADASQQQDFSQEQSNDLLSDAPARQQGLSGVQKPPFNPQEQTGFQEPEEQQIEYRQDNAPEQDETDYTFLGAGGPDITGAWSSNIGSTYQFGNNLNGSIFFYEYNALQVEVGYGEGGYLDGTFTFEYTNHLLQLSATVQMQMAPGSGNLLQAVAYMDGVQPASFELYRMPTATGL